MNLLITGSEGSLMQAVIPLLLERGHTIRGVDNFARYGELQRERAYDFVRGDLTNAQFAAEAVSGVDAVLQAAGLIYGVGGFHRRPADILSRDVTLHSNILEAMRNAGVMKIAYVSSSMVYERCHNHPSREEDVFDSLLPSTEYGLSKVVGERLVLAFARQYGMQYTIWRPFNIITPHEKSEKEQGESHVFADFIHNIVEQRKNPLPIIGDGEQIRCFTWISDVAHGIATHSFDDSRADGQIFNLGNPEPITMRELANLIHAQAQELGLLSVAEQPLKFETTTSYADDVKRRIPDIGKASGILGWKPTVKVTDSVRTCLSSL